MQTKKDSDQTAVINDIVIQRPAILLLTTLKGYTRDNKDNLIQHNFRHFYLSGKL